MDGEDVAPARIWQCLHVISYQWPGEVTNSFISCGCGGGTLLARVFDELTSDRLLGDDEMSDEMGRARAPTPETTVRS